MRKLIFIMLFIGLIPVTIQAGNPDRAGQAGASELLINPWAQSVGINGINISSVTGIDAMRLNVGGLAYLSKTAVSFSRTQYLVGSNADISVNALGFGQRLGEGVLGISVVTVGYGDIEITTVDQPEGGIGTYKPQFFHLGLGYSHTFADFIRGGVVVRVISEQIADVSAQGVALDAGLVYSTGPDAFPEKFKFGVSMRNVGTPMTFSGDGLTFRTNVITGDYEQSAYQQSQAFELPLQLNIGASYDMYVKSKHRLTAMGSFSSNAFYKDQFGGGLEYGLSIKEKEMFVLRAGYKYESGIFDAATRTNLHTGLAAGFTFMVPLTGEEDAPRMAIDYGYRTSDPFNGSHTLGLRLDL